MTGVEAAVLAVLADDPLRAALLVVVGALLEGPVVTVTAAALAGAGLLSWWSVWLAAVSADVLADTLLYALGRRSGQGRSRRVLARLGLTDERRDALTARVHTHLPQVVISAKLVDVGAVPAFLAAGLAGVGLRRFLVWVVPATMLRSGVLVGIGFVAGEQFSEDLAGRPWLLAAGGLAVGAVLIAGRAAISRLAERSGRSASWRPCRPPPRARRSGVPSDAAPGGSRPCSSPRCRRA